MAVVIIDVTEDECRGLMWLADSFEEHLREGLGTGDPADDERARSACRLLGRITSTWHAARAKDGK